jgi:hypothetical protein
MKVSIAAALACSIGLLGSSAMAASTSTNFVVTVKHAAPAITFVPSAPSIFDDLAAGQTVATATITMTTGKPFTGTVTFADPSNVFSLVPANPQTAPPSWNITVGAGGLLSLIPAGQPQIVDTVKITATQ